MKKAIIAGAVLAVVALFLVTAGRARREKAWPAAPAPEAPSAAQPGTSESRIAAPGFLYGRIRTIDGEAYEGRLRFGGDEEAFWGDYFKGVKHENPWLALLTPEQRPKEHGSFQIFGWQIGERVHPVEVRRQLTARFGEIARIESLGRAVRVTRKSGTVVDVNRFDASDFDDGVRVWDATRGAVDLDSTRIGTIELLPHTTTGAVPDRLHGTVRTRAGDLTGFIEWDRHGSLGTDELHGRSDDRDVAVRFDTIRSIVRREHRGAVVTFADGRDVVLSGSRDVGRGNRGICVDDARYGRVVVSWDALDRADFDRGDSGPAYGDYPPGAPLRGSVTTRTGGRFSGRLVYDLDESETTDTLDAPSEGLQYTIPFGLIASIVPSSGDEHGASRPEVTLRNGERLQLESDGDLGAQNAGVLIFVEGRPQPDYVPWADVAKVELEDGGATYPPIAGPSNTAARVTDSSAPSEPRRLR